MTHRDPRIRLPHDIARCAPAHPCDTRQRCARYMATVPAHGGSMADFSIRAAPVICCGSFIPLTQAEAEQAPRAVKPWPGEG